MKYSLQKKILIWLLLAIALFLELGCLTYLRGYFGVYGSPLVLFCSGIFTGIFFLYLSKNQRLKIVPVQIPKWIGILEISIFAIGIYSCYTLIKVFVDVLPHNTLMAGQGSDVIPLINILLNRFLDGDFPYQLITQEDWGFNHHIFPTYLPLMWIPFIGAEFLGIDYRIFAFIIFVLSCLFYYWKVVCLESNIIGRLLSIALPFIIFYVFSSYNASLKFVIESLIVGFYLLLASSLFAKRTIWLTIALILCLLSRYSIILFVPLIFLIVGFEKGWTKSIKMASFTGFAILFLYLVPFLAKDATIFSKGYDYYTKATLSVWERSEKRGILDNKSMFTSGIGMSIFAAKYLDAPIATKLKIYQRLHLILSLGVVILLAFFYYKFHKDYDYRFFLLGGMKIYLVVFYSFIQQPFVYLFLVPIFISVPIFSLSTILLKSTKLKETSL